MSGTNEMNSVNDGGRFPVYLLLDTSWSMAGNIDELQSAIRDIYNQIKNEPQIEETAAICIIEFNSTVNQIIALSRPWDIQSDFTFSARGVTLTGEALKFVNAQAKSELHFASRSRAKADLKPLLIILTDGKCTDENGTANERGKALLAEGVASLSKWWGGILACGMGDFSPEELRTITPNVVEVKDVKEFFKVAMSTIKASSKIASSSESLVNSGGKVYDRALQASISQHQNGGADVSAPTFI